MKKVTYTVRARGYRAACEKAFALAGYDLDLYGFCYGDAFGATNEKGNYCASLWYCCDLEAAEAEVIPSISKVYTVTVTKLVAPSSDPAGDELARMAAEFGVLPEPAPLIVF